VRLSHDAWLGWLGFSVQFRLLWWGCYSNIRSRARLPRPLDNRDDDDRSGAAAGAGELVGKRNRSLEQLGISDALAVGFAQVLALIPGSSRSVLRSWPGFL